MSVWIKGQAVNFDPWTEIGVIKHDDGNNTYRAKWFGFCGLCDNPTGEWAPFSGKINASPGDYFALWYASNGCWQWWLNGKKEWEHCSLSFSQGGREVRVGGETTWWDVDMGVIRFYGLQVRYSGDWHSFTPHRAPDRHRAKGPLRRPVLLLLLAVLREIRIRPGIWFRGLGLE